MTQLITKTSFKKFLLLFPYLSLYIFHAVRDSVTFLPCTCSAMFTVRSDFWLCPKVTFSVITSYIHAYGYLPSWNPFLIVIVFLFLALMERCKEAALDWLSDMSPSQELVFCWISPTRSLKFECSQMVHAKGKGGWGSFPSGVIFSRYIIFFCLYYQNNSTGNTVTVMQTNLSAYFSKQGTS